MSVATSFPYMKLGHPSTPCCTSPCSSSSTSPSLRFSPIIRNKYSSFTVKSSQAEGPLRRPVASPVRPPNSPSPQPPNPAPVKQPSPTVAQQIPMAVAPGQATGVVTLEFQRQKAKELQEFFKQKKLEEADQGPVFGFIGKNEISNGRWAMFGFAVGMLTEYATGSDFVDQIKILISNFGILDLE